MRTLFVLLVTIVSVSQRHQSNGHFDVVEDSGCHDREFRLDCKSLSAKIAIFEARYTQEEDAADGSSCRNSTQPVSKLKNWEKQFLVLKNSPEGFLVVDFRHAINRRCSGANYCSFIFREDFDLGPRLGPGAVFLRYACFEDSNVSRACNSNVDASKEGFARTPGYPSYYIGENVCQWTLFVPDLQRIKLSFLDISLRSIGPHETTCIDHLTVSENGLKLLFTCGDTFDELVLFSDSSAINVTLVTSSKTLFPKRGLLFHYKAVGCPLLRNPEDGYLIHRNESSAHYRCSIGFVFPDSLSRDRILKCYNENAWDGEVVDCISESKLHGQKIILRNGTDENDLVAARKMETTDSFKDIIVPSIIICVLFLGNGLVLYYIYCQRKKLAQEEKIELDELKSKEVRTEDNC